jgi:hypothetical protein
MVFLGSLVADLNGITRQPLFDSHMPPFTIRQISLGGGYAKVLKGNRWPEG